MPVLHRCGLLCAPNFLNVLSLYWCFKIYSLIKCSIFFSFWVLVFCLLFSPLSGKAFLWIFMLGYWVFHLVSLMISISLVNLIFKSQLVIIISFICTFVLSLALFRSLFPYFFSSLSCLFLSCLDSLNTLTFMIILLNSLSWVHLVNTHWKTFL